MIKFDWNILWIIINLIILFVLMRLFLFKPIQKTIDKRNELIQNQFKEAEETTAQANILKSEYEKKLEDAKLESKEIIDEAKGKAQKEYKSIVDRADADVKKLKEDAQKQIASDAENAKRAAREDIARLAMEAAEKVIGSKVSSETDSDIFDQFLKESSDNNES